MSFYQPSLSLYDVLNALSNQAPVNRDPREQLFRSQGYGPQSFGYGGFGGGGAPSGLPSGLIYRLPGDTCYYRPDYYYTGEDEDEEAEEEAEEELEESERAQRLQEQEQRRGYVSFPSYYHSRAPKGGVQEALEESDPLTELVSALLGNAYGAPTRERATPQAPSRRSAENEENLVKQALLEKLGQEAEQGSAAESVAAAAAAAKDKDKAEEKAPLIEKKTEPEVTGPSKPKEKVPFPLNRKPSAVPSQTSGPLQVSKPEARLDLPFSPEVNIYDCPDQYVVATALPGATSKGFKVDYHPSTHELILKGDIEDKLGISEDFLKVTELKYGADRKSVV